MSIAIISNFSYIFPSKEKCRTFRGNFCGLNLNLPYSPGGILFTPAYPIYNNNTRRLIRQAYLKNGYTHFPINLTNQSPIYRNFYPNWNDTLINIYLYELLHDGIIPVCSAFSDGYKTFNPNVDSNLVPIVFPGWENPQPIVRPSLDSDNLFYQCHKQYPKALVYWHHPPYQGAPYVDPKYWGGNPEPNAAVWNYMVHESSVQGLLFQGQAWTDGGVSSIARLNDFNERLVKGNDGWPICDLVDFEETAYYMFDENGSYAQAVRWTTKIWKSFPKLNGYCNGIESNNS